MKILVYGAGIIGSTYAWQLSQAGHDVSVFVRKGKKQLLESEGIKINCTDFRGNKREIIKTTFRPEVIEELSQQNKFEFIIVSVNNIQLKQVLPVLSEGAGNANILFFQNNWDDFDEIDKYLSSEKYLFGFPFIVGGGRDEQGIRSVISGMKQANTLVGESNGENTPRLNKIVSAFNDANLKPAISKQIIPWLVSHYAVAAGLSAGVMKAEGSMKNFTSSDELIKEAIMSIREGFEVCQKRGINPKKEKSNTIYYLPFFISIPIIKKVFSNEIIGLMFEGHVRHAPDEMKKMVQDILEKGKEYNIRLPILEGFQRTLRS